MFPAILSKTWWRSLVKGEAGDPADKDPDELEQLEEEETLLMQEESDGSEDDSDDIDEGSDDFEDEEEVASPSMPWRGRVDNAKDFFAGEVIYRYDILGPSDQSRLKGSYRVEVKGNKGGVWTLLVGDQLEVLNRREDAEIVLSIQQREFVQLINGELNPQMAILAQKLRLTGDIKKVALFQSLLSPPNQE